MVGTPAFVMGAAAKEEINEGQTNWPGAGQSGEGEIKAPDSGTPNSSAESEESGGELQGAEPSDGPERTQDEPGKGSEEKADAEKNGDLARLRISPEPVTVVVGTSIKLSVQGYAKDDSEVNVPQDQVIWKLETDGGTSVATLSGAVLTAGDKPGSGVITAEYSGLTAEVPLNVVAPEQMASAGSEWVRVFEDFENIEDVRVTSVQANSAVLDQAERPEPVKYGLKSGRLKYDFTNNSGTSAAYIRFKNPDGKDGRDIPGKPKKIGFWVYGEDKQHWIRGQVQDSLGKQTTLDFTKSSDVLNGWRYVTADVPNGAEPIKLNYIYLVETGTKSAGTLYVDQVSIIYENNDIFGVEWSGVKPLGIGQTVQAGVLVTRNGVSEPQAAESGSVTYASSDESVATVDATGKITALAAGETELTATYRNQYSAVYRLVVSQNPVMPERLLIEGPLSLVLTETANLKAFAVYGRGEPVDVSAEAVFETEPGSSIAEITGRQIRALQVGETTVTAKFEGQDASYKVQVKASELKSIEIQGVFSVVIGEEAPSVKVYGDYKAQGKKEITTGITFGSTNANAAIIDQVTGQITAKSPGTTMITAEVEGKKAQQLLVVTNPAAHPKREMRGAWISTVENIDWPTKGEFDPEKQRQDFVKLLDELKETGINAVFVQVRPTSDSFFPSEYFPWSHWLTGEQGKAPSDGYDPLKFMIEEAHKRNLEFHAWINPYRISMHDKPELLAESHPARVHPDWVVKNNGKLYFNPAIVDAQNYIINGVKEIVQKYDVDGIHMDDYFYPYPGDEPFNDSKEYNEYKNGGGTKSLADWRRDNVNSIVEGLNTGVKSIKPYVKFGISPFGIWRNKGSDPTGSDTNGLQNYDDLYADARTWMKNGWVDYLAPQIYWHFGNPAAAYEKLIDWWTKEINGEHDHSGKHNIQLYIGQAAYRVGESNWTNPDQLPAQLRYNNDQGNNIAGNIMFSTSDLLRNPLGVRDAVASMYSRPALVPVMPWLPDDTPDAPVLTGLKGTGGSIELAWKDNGDKAPAYYAVYRVNGKGIINPNDASQLIDTVRRVEGETQIYTDQSAAAGQDYTYAVSAVSRLHHESGLSNPLSSQAEEAAFASIKLGDLRTMTVSQTQQVKVYGILATGEKREISDGVTFTSSEPKTASISPAGLITALAEGKTVIKAEFKGLQASYTLKVEAAPTTNPGSGGSSSGSGGSSGTSPSSPATPPPAKDSGIWIVSDRDLDKVKGGKLDIQIGSGMTQVQLPGSTAARLGKEGTLNLHAEGISLSIPSSVLEEAIRLAAGADPNGLKIMVDIEPLAADKAAERLKQLRQNEKNAVLTAGRIFRLGISVQTKDGKSSSLPQFGNKVKLTLDIPEGAKPERTGIYRITASAMEYVGGKREEKRLTVLVNRPGQYSAIAYDQTFKDVAVSHWAAEVIKDMAARHVLGGFPDGSFAPDKQVTRAEFASMLARILDLPAGQGVTFTDIGENAWYGKEIAAAVQAGIVQGSGDGKFHPDQSVTREEMAVMLVNAYAAAGGRMLDHPSDNAFKDQGQISKWAQEAINKAVGAGLLQGSGGNFNPAQGTTRAESARALANLLAKIEKLP